MTTAEQVICVDIDGVIAQPIVGADYKKAAVMPGAVTALGKIMAMGYSVHLYTGRHVIHAEETHNWLDFHGVPYDVVVWGNGSDFKYFRSDTCRPVDCAPVCCIRELIEDLRDVVDEEWGCDCGDHMDPLCLACRARAWLEGT